MPDPAPPPASAPSSVSPAAHAAAPGSAHRFLPDRAAPGEPVIRVRELVRRFGDVTAVDRVSFDVADGEVFGLLGPNGAGKTTLVETLECLHPPNDGGAEVLGYDIVRDTAEVKERIGVQLQSASYHQYLTLTEILELFGSFYRRALPPAELLRWVRLEDRGGARLGQLSGGMRQRFSIVAALVNDPRLAFFDEPTSGLDPDARRDLWALVQEVRARGTTVVLTTHYMEEAETLCDRVAILDRGRVRACDTPAALVRGLDAPYRIRLTTDRALPAEVLRAVPHVIDVSAEESADGPRATLRARRAAEVTAALLALTGETGAAVRDLAVEPATLEDVFLHLTGREMTAATGAADAAATEPAP